ncbi:MAG: DUF664 domain-containing protein [bacterium]|nr:DUF664 domain-containing protein [bacterium]
MAEANYAAPIKQSLLYLSRTCSVFKDEDSGFAPTPAQFTVAQHVAHVAQTIDWFVEGAFRPEGFDLDFASHQTAIRQCATLQDALTWLTRAVDNAGQVLAAKTDQEMLAPLPAGPIMAGQPRAAIVAAIAEHTAHHRGALAVYARLLGHAPPMPYAE